jgi:signal transduction histidine kinase
MKIRNKILLAIWGSVLVLLLITYFIVKYWTQVQVEARSTDALRSNYTTLRELTSLRSEEIAKSCEIVAETPRLKAVVELRDPNTATQLSQELNKSLMSDLFLVKDARGKMLVRIIDGKPDSVHNPARDAAGLQPGTAESPQDVRFLNGSVYRCATAPITVGPDTLGTVTLGFRIEKSDLDAIKAMTNSDVVLVSGGSIVSSTLSPDAEKGFSEWLPGGSGGVFDSAKSGERPVAPITTANDHYLGKSFLLSGNGAGSPAPVLIVVLRPVAREVEAALEPVFNAFFVLSILVLLATAAIGFVISQGITHPIEALVRGTAEISRGNYDYAIAVGSDAEIRFLAEKFTEMSVALKDKMNQLAVRNSELEEALRRLKEMQTELVKSERLAATGKLTAQLSHEINNPVHNIQSLLQTLLKRFNSPETDPRGRELLDTALEEVTRLARLTRQMLDVYRTSIVEIEREPLSLNEVIQEVVTTSAEVFRKQHIGVRLSLHPELPLIQGSRDKLKQVFLNLLLNAKDAMPEGGTLTVQTDKHNGSVVAHVTDTGVGIPPENINRVFDAFFTTKSKVSGVGLGLSVTYGIVRQHAGSISVKSILGKGATFSVTLPVNS